MEIVIRAAVVYFFVWWLMRALGKRDLSEISALELVLLIVIGDLVQQGITQEDMSVTGAVLAVGTIAFLILGASYLGFRRPGARPVLEGLPVIVVRDGKVEQDAMHVERLTEDDIRDEARQKGIDDLAKVRVGILEPDGKFSFVTAPGSEGEEAQEHRAK